LIDAQLQEENLIRFLRPGWVGNANIVLTTLRDLELLASSARCRLKDGPRFEASH
jgi:hypothetical protein